MTFSIDTSNRLVTFKAGTVLFLLSLGFTFAEFIGFIIFAFLTHDPPAMSAFVYLVWRIFDFLHFQSLSSGVLCFAAGVLNSILQFNLSLYKMLFISTAFAIIFYVFIVYQLIDDGLILKSNIFM